MKIKRKRTTSYFCKEPRKVWWCVGGAVSFDLHSNPPVGKILRGFGESVFGPSPDVPRGMTSHTTCFCMVASARPDPPPIVSCWIAVLITTLVSTGSKSPDDKEASPRTIKT